MVLPGNVQDRLIECQNVRYSLTLLIYINQHQLWKPTSHSSSIPPTNLRQYFHSSKRLLMLTDLDFTVCVAHCITIQWFIFGQLITPSGTFQNKVLLFSEFWRPWGWMVPEDRQLSSSHYIPVYSHPSVKRIWQIWNDNKYDITCRGGQMSTRWIVILHKFG